MSKNSIITLEIENWGPVAKGNITFKPLTVFIGPNNTGKSYIAMLYYALIKALRYTSPRGIYYASTPSEIPIIKSKGIIPVTLYTIHKKSIMKKIGETTSQVCLLARANPKKGKQKLHELIYELLLETQSQLNKDIKARASALIKREIERIFSSKVADLIRFGTPNATVKLRLSGKLADILCHISISAKGKANISLEFSVSDNALHKRIESIINNISPTLKHLSGLDSKNPQAVQLTSRLERQIFEHLDNLIKEYISDVLSLLKDIHYLPASRAGILHSYRTVARAIISIAPLAPIRGTEIPKIPGPIADFLSNLIEISPEEKEIQEPYTHISKQLEQEILEGEVRLMKGTPETPPTLVYKPDDYEIPIARTSSMIAETAPLALYLKYGIIEEGDTVIIEEPEAHLHPDKQAKLAELLAYLINKLNIRIIITTHSDILLAKLSNLVSLSALPPEEIKKLG